MVDEERLADALSTHIDAILAGQPLPLEDSPEELRQLLGLADQLTAIDLPPRPAFDQQIRQSLSGRHRGGNGGPTHSGNMPLLLVLGLVALIGIIGVIALTAAVVVGTLLPQRDRLATSTPRALSTIIAPTSPASAQPPLGTPSLPSLTPAPETTATPQDAIRSTPASTRDELFLKVTPSPAPPRNLGGQTDRHTGSNSGGDSDDGDDEDDEDDEEDEED